MGLAAINDEIKTKQKHENFCPLNICQKVTDHRRNLIVTCGCAVAFLQSPHLSTSNGILYKVAKILAMRGQNILCLQHHFLVRLAFGTMAGRLHGITSNRKGLFLAHSDIGKGVWQVCEVLKLPL